MLAWISSEISTKLQGMPTHLDRSSVTGTGLTHAYCSFHCLVSTGHSRHPSQLPSPSSFGQLLLAFPSYFRSRRDRGLRPLFGFTPKQTKRSSPWRTTYIVLQWSLSWTSYVWSEFKSYRVIHSYGLVVHLSNKKISWITAK